MNRDGDKNMNECCKLPHKEVIMLDVVELVDMITGQTVIMSFQDVMKNGYPIGLMPKISLYESRKTMTFSKKMYDQMKKIAEEIVDEQK
jgi:hypothetical protein